MADKLKKSRIGRLPTNEGKADKFVRVVSPRVKKAIKCILIIGNCAGSGYSFTEHQHKQITDALYMAVNQLEARFAGKKETVEFTFKP